MSGHAHSIGDARSVWFGRSFVVLATTWLVAQGHHGSFLGDWSREASLPGNACWLLILYCQLRLALGWAGESWRDRRPHPDFLLQMLCLVTLEGANMASGNPLALPLFGQLMYFAQPLIVLAGFAALYRRVAVSN